MDRSDWTVTKFDATGDWDESTPSELLTPHERLNMTWPLIRAMWKLRYGIDPQYGPPRDQWKVVKVDLLEEWKKAEKA